MNELALTESPSLRAQYADRVEVLDKVKALTLLPDGMHADIPVVADYYEVGVEAIKSVIHRNRAELEDNGLHVLRGKEYREFASCNLNLANPNARSITLFTRRAILNVGQMLTESRVAEAVRKHLLDVEERSRQQQAAPPQAITAPDPLAPVTYPLADTVVLMRQRFGVKVPVTELTRVLRQGGVLCQNGKPKVDYEAIFWHTGTAYEVFGHRIEALYRLYESTKLRLEMAAQARLRMDPPGWPELPFDGAS